MKRFAPISNPTTLIVRLSVVVFAALFLFTLTVFIAPTASTQDDGGQAHVAERVSSSLTRADSKERAKSSDPDEVATESSAPAPISSEAISGTSYPFTSGAAVLEDMSTGTTQLVAAGSDDGASPVTNIGFDFWYDGVRFTQFSVNANGLARLGSTIVTTEFDNGSATFGFNTTTNAPKIAPYFDDIWSGTNGNVRFKVVGTAPNRKLVVEWNNMTIPRPGAATTGAGTFQMWLFESAAATGPGVIQFVYGNGIVANATNGGYSIGLQSGVATNFASVTTTGPSVSYAVANNTQSNAIASGTSYLFTPNVPLAPSAMANGPITATSITLNWGDNATNEIGYVIYRSTDNVNFSFRTQLAAGSTTFTDTSLVPGTQYFYLVNAVTEGALSPNLALSATTLAAGADTCSGTPTLWTAPTSWLDGTVPTNGDIVTIQSGCTLAIDTAAPAAYRVIVQSGGTLQFDTLAAATLTVGENVTIDAGGTFTAGPGALNTHVLSLAGSLTNNGTLDFQTTGGAGITFTGESNNTFGGTGATTDIRTLTINKGTSNANTLELNPTNFTVQGTVVDGAPMAFLTLTNGTFKISGTFTVAGRVFTAAAYTIGATTGFWLNNPNFTVSGQGGSPTNNGLLRITQGTFNIGTGTGNSMGFGNASTTIVEGGAVNATGRFGVNAAANAITYTQSAGTVTVCTIGNASATLASFDLGTSLGSSINISGGTIVNQLASTGATQIDYRNQAGSGILALTGGTLQLGNAGSGAAKAFVIRGVVPNLVLNNTSGNHSASWSTVLVNFNNISLNITINVGNTLNFGNNVFLFNGTTLTNNGTLTHNGASSNFVWFLATAPVSYTGTGVVTAPMSNMAIQADQGLTFDPTSPNIVTPAVRLFSGNVTNANKITLGNGGATTGIVQIGNTTTPTAAGTFDLPFVFNLGTGGQIISYLRTTTSRTTGPEVNPTRTLFSLSRDDNDPTHTLTIAGGDLTMTSVLTGTSSALQLTNGRIITGANTLILPNQTSNTTRTAGHVDGNLRKAYTAAISRTFEVGTANSYSPATMNVTAVGAPSTLTVRAVQGSQPVLNPATSLQRYWSVTESGDVTATMTFNYATDGLDVVGTEAAYRIIRVSGATAVYFPEVCPAGPCVDEAANNFIIPGVSTFSDWTAGEPAAPTAAPAMISGRVTTASGAPLAGVVMYLSGARSGKTISDSNGNYRFQNVDTENFYTVTPAIVNYKFSPLSRSFSLQANMTDAVFTGVPDAGSTGNVIDSPEYFVRQHYLDFLGREPDEAGLNFWSDQMLGCGNDFNCIERRTINVSAAYFLSIEFQETGGLVDGLYRASYGRAPLFGEFGPDTATVAREVIVGETGWQNRLAANKQEFLDDWVERPAFRAAYDGLSNSSFVDTLIGHTRVEFTAEERAAFVSGLEGNTLTRSAVLQRIAQNERFVKAKFNEAFVRMQYFGYLRRDPDDSGFHFWLDKLNQFEGNFERAEMVKAFITSGEYRARFVR